MKTKTTRFVFSWACFIAACLMAGAALFPLPVAGQMAGQTSLSGRKPAPTLMRSPRDNRGLPMPGLFRWDLRRENQDSLGTAAMLELGIFRNPRFAVQDPSSEDPYFIGPAMREDGLDDIEVIALYKMNQPQWIPGIALSGAFKHSKVDNNRLDAGLRFIASKILDRNTLWNQLHINASWKYNSDAKQEDRKHYSETVIGYDFRIGSKTLMVVDFAREEKERRNEEANVFEAGLRYEFSPITAFAVGAGGGVGDESPDVRLSFGFQHSF